MRLDFFTKLGMVAISLSLSSKLTYGLTNVSAASCPKKFLGVVERVVHPQAPFSLPEKVQVSITVKDVLKGDVQAEEKFYVVKNGPVAFEVGQEVQVEMRDNFLCSYKTVN